MKTTKKPKKLAAGKAVEKLIAPPPVVQTPASAPVSQSRSFDPERDEEVYDDERGEHYLRKTPLGMLEEAEAEVNQRELADYRDTISLLRQKGFSFREIGEFLTKRGVFADHNAVYRIYTKFMTPEEMEEEEQMQQEDREREIE